MKAYPFLLGCIVIQVLSSCNKDKIPEISKKEMLTAREWVIQKFEEREITTPWADVFPFWSACEKDNKWIFKPDFGMELSESAIACSGSTPNAILDEVNWAFAENETKITIENNTYLIERLDETALIITISQVVNGITLQERITYEH